MILIEICTMGPGTQGVGNQWVLLAFNGYKRIVMAETRSTENGRGVYIWNLKTYYRNTPPLGMLNRFIINHNP